MKKAKLIKRLFTNEEIIAIDNRNRELEKENKKLREEIKERQEEVERFKSNAMADADYELKLEEENKKLKEDIDKLQKIIWELE